MSFFLTSPAESRPGMVAGTFLSAGLGPNTPTVNFWSELEALPVGPPASGMTRNPDTLTLDPEPEILSQVILKGRHLTPPPFVRDGEGACDWCDAHPESPIIHPGSFCQNSESFRFNPVSFLLDLETR